MEGQDPQGNRMSNNPAPTYLLPLSYWLDGDIEDFPLKPIPQATAKVVTFGGAQPSDINTRRLRAGLRRAASVDQKGWATVWAVPSHATTRKQIQTLNAWIAQDSATARHLVGIDLDCEEPWVNNRDVKGAANEWVALAREHGLRLSVNFVPGTRKTGHKVPRSVLDLFEVAHAAGVLDHATAQFYEQYRPEKPWTMNAEFRPGVWIREGFARTEANTPCPLHVGHMAAFRNHPKPYQQGGAATREALVAAKLMGAKGFALWSWKHQGCKDFLENKITETPDPEEDALIAQRVIDNLGSWGQR